MRYRRQLVYAGNTCNCDDRTGGRAGARATAVDARLVDRNRRIRGPATTDKQERQSAVSSSNRTINRAERTCRENRVQFQRRRDVIFTSAVGRVHE